MVGTQAKIKVPELSMEHFSTVKLARTLRKATTTYTGGLGKEISFCCTVMRQ